MSSIIFNNLHHPTCKLTKDQKGVSYNGIRIFNNLANSIKNLLQDLNKFKYSLKKILQVGSFYSLEEYYEWKTWEDCVYYR
jgi:N-acetylglucosamine kinase-like BadF-type ATPase